MCGIAGIVTLDGSPLEDGMMPRLQAMSRALAHRGPDDDGSYLSPSRSAAFAHRRLSIIDPTPNAHQPYVKGHTALTFNGEILNYKDLRTEAGLEQETSDTVVLSHLLWQRGVSALVALRGFFAFGYWDENAQALLLARDAIGKKPIYYARRGNHLLFASELRALMESGLVPFRLSAEALDRYLAYYSVPAPHSVIEGVSVLPPGHYLEVRQGKIRVERWWRLPEHRPLTRSRNQIAGEVRERLTSSVRSRLVADVPLAAFHSGGIDSNVVVGIMSRSLRTQVRTFNVDFGDHEETSVAQAAAQHFGTAHQVSRVTADDIRNALPAFFYRMDSPTGDGLNSFIVSRAVSQAAPDIKVVLSGVGGDELFLGYKKIRALAKLKRVLSLTNRLPSSLTQLLPATKYGNALKALIDPLDLRVLFDARERSSLTGTPPIRTDRQAVEQDLLLQLQRSDIEEYLPNMLLRDLDVCSMAHQLEARAPFLDKDLVEFCWSIPQSEKSAGASKQLLVDAFDDLLPDAVKRKRKTGFEMPIAKWLKHGPLRPLLDDVLQGTLDIIRDGHLDRSAVQTIARLFERGEVHYLKVWSLIALEYWYRSFTTEATYEDWCSGAWQAK